MLDTCGPLWRLTAPRFSYPIFCGAVFFRSRPSRSVARALLVGGFHVCFSARLLVMVACVPLPVFGVGFVPSCG